MDAETRKYIDDKISSVQREIQQSGVKNQRNIDDKFNRLRNELLRLIGKGGK